MANEYKTLADLVLVNDMNLYDVVMKDVLDSAPFMAAAASDEASNGTQHKYLKYTTLPTVGHRAINAGREHSKSVDEAVTVDTEILDCSFTVDQKLADNYKNGPEAYIMREANRHLRAGFFTMEKQSIYGKQTGGDATGPDGMADTINALAGGRTINAGGSVGNIHSSVWFVRSTPDDFQVVIGAGGNITISPTTTIRAEQVGTPDTYYPAYFTPVSGNYAFQIGSIWAFARIANIDDGSQNGGANQLTDDLLSDALALFPMDHQPTHILMSRRSRGQLQKSRTSYNQVGEPAMLPTTYEGIPIVVTEAILDTEAPLT